MTIIWFIFALASGTLLGALYFGGLWLTVRWMAHSQQPALLFGVSFLVRAAVLLLGLYFVMDGLWHRLIACMLGFLLARTLWVYCLPSIRHAWTRQHSPSTPRS